MKVLLERLFNSSTNSLSLSLYLSIYFTLFISFISSLGIRAYRLVSMVNPGIAFPITAHVVSTTFELDRDNFFFWRSQVLEAIRTHDLKGFLDISRASLPQFIQIEEKLDDRVNSCGIWKCRSRKHYHSQNQDQS